MREYSYYFGAEGADGYFHSDKDCDVMQGEMWGDMTENSALKAMKDDDDYDPCPECVDL